MRLVFDVEKAFVSWVLLRVQYGVLLGRRVSRQFRTEAVVCVRVRNILSDAAGRGPDFIPIAFQHDCFQTIRALRPGDPRHALRMRVAVLRPKFQPFANGLGKRLGRAAIEEAGMLRRRFRETPEYRAPGSAIYAARPRSAAIRSPRLRKRRSGRSRRHIILSKSASLTSSNQNNRLPNFG